MNIKREAFRRALMGLVAVSLASCTPMPTINSFKPSTQLKLSSASHWKIIASEVSQDVSSVISDGDKCIRFDPPVAQSESQFETFLTAAVTQQLISDNRAANRTAHIYSIIPADSDCNVITLKASVIEHRGPVARPYPGKYTLLAAGLVGIRHVVRAFSEASFFGSVAVGEAAYWASAGFQSSDTVTEITITVSYIDPHGIFLSENTNIYYIDTSDSALYKSRAIDATLANSDIGSPGSHPPSPAIAEKIAAFDGQNPDSRSKRRRLEVHPDTISVCDTSAEFIVSGEYLGTQHQDFMFGTIVASGFGSNAPLSTDARQTAQVKFAALNKANVGLDEISLSMIGADGVASATFISVSGDSKACPVAKAETSGIANTVLTGVGAAADISEVCRGPWSLAVSGANAGDVKKAKIILGNHDAVVKRAADGKTVTLQFDPLTEYRTKPLPSGDKIAIQLADSQQKTVSKSVSVTCQGQQIKIIPPGKPQDVGQRPQPPAPPTTQQQTAPQQTPPPSGAAQHVIPQAGTSQAQGQSK